jgi:hypothetical protein
MRAARETRSKSPAGTPVAAAAFEQATKSAEQYYVEAERLESAAKTQEEEAKVLTLLFINSGGRGQGINIIIHKLRRKRPRYEMIDID